MIPNPSPPAVRAVLSSARASSMARGLDAGLAVLEEHAPRLIAGSPFAELCLANARAELLALDGREPEALEQLAMVDQALPKIEPHFRFAILDNRLLLEGVLSASRGENPSFHQDRRRVAGFRFRDERQVLEADEAFQRGDFRNSHGLYWAALWDAYQGLSWRATRQAASRYARQCLALRQLERAIFLAAIGLDSNLATSVASALLAGRQPAATRACLSMILSTGALRRHQEVFCKFLAVVEDGIADEDLLPLLGWLLQVAGVHPQGSQRRPRAEAAWDVIAKFAPRPIPPAQAETVARAAMNHPELSVPGPTRKRLLNVMTSCALRLSEGARDEVALCLLGLAAAGRQDVDYAEIIVALQDLTKIGGERWQAQIIEKLYGGGVPFENYALLASAPDFGVRLDPTQLDEYARQVARFLRLQVQRIGPEAAPEKIPGYGIVELGSPEGKLCVTMCGNIPNLRVLVVHREKVSETALNEVLEAALSAVEDDDNIPMNRCGLIEHTGFLFAGARETIRNPILGRLLPFAFGLVPRRPSPCCFPGKEDPLSHFSCDLGSDADIRSDALIALGRLSSDGPDIGPEVAEAIALGLASNHAKVRQGALIACGLLRSLPATLLPGVLLSTRDAQPRVAESGFWALSRIDPGVLEREGRELLHFAVGVATQSPDPTIREGAARAVGHICARASQTMRDRFEGLRQMLALDECHSVRGALAVDGSLAQHPSEGGPGCIPTEA
jgi:hypothetical protein